MSLIHRIQSICQQSHASTLSERQAHRAEKGFYASHCSVEHTFAHSILALQQLQSLLTTTTEIDSDISITMSSIVKRKLRLIAYNVRNAATSLRQMRHFYDASHFYHILRPYLKCGNIAENGVIFELDDDVNDERESHYTIALNNGTRRSIGRNQVIYGLRGPSGAGTTSLSSIDAGLQITTSIQANPSLEITMNEFRQFHPNEHYQFNDVLRSSLQLRDKILLSTNNNQREVIDAYNDAVIAVAQFRNSHVEHVGTYILKSIQSIHPKDVRGTGNTPIVKYLCDSFFGTLQSLITNKDTDSNDTNNNTDSTMSKDVSSNLPDISIDSICIGECLSGKYDIHNRQYCQMAIDTLSRLKQSDPALFANTAMD